MSAERDARADLLIRIAESGTAPWREKLLQILHLSAQTFLDNSSFGQRHLNSALTAYRELHERLLSETVVNEDLLKEVRFGFGQLLCQQNDFAGAVQMFNSAMPLTQNLLNPKKVKRILVVLEELTKVGRTDDVFSVAIGVIDSGLLSSPTPNIIWLADVMLIFLENNYPLLAEKLLTCALNACEKNLQLESLMCISFSVHNHFKTSVLAQLRTYTKTRGWLYPNLSRLEQLLADP